MAKTRRILRKTPAQAHGDFFDESLWPVYIALVVLGAFLMGVSIAYLRFAGVPWYRNAWLSLVGIPVVIAGFMLAFRYVDNRLLRRTMQFSVVVCALLHLVLIVYLKETTLFSMLRDDVVVERSVIEARPPKVVAEYRPQDAVPDQDKPKDFEKPVETEAPTPQETPQPVKQPVETPAPEVPKEQTIPVKESVPVNTPNIVRKEQPNQAAPKAAEETSQLSRQSKPSEVKVSSVAELPKAVEKSAATEARPKMAAVQKQSATASASRSNSTDEPATKIAAATASTSKKTAETSNTPADSSTPTMKRPQAQPAQTPQAAITTAETPSVTKATRPDEPRPSTTLATKKSTESPETAKLAAEPTLDPSRDPAAQPKRRELPSEAAPTMAQTPSPVANQKPKATVRPDSATMAAIASPNPSAANSAAKPSELAPASSKITKATTAQVSTAKPAEVPSAVPSTPDLTTPSAKVAGRMTSDNPAVQANPEALATRSQKSTSPSLAAPAQVDTATAAATTSPTTGELSAKSTAVKKQATASTEVAPRPGETAAAQVAMASPSVAPNAATGRKASKQTASADSPVANDKPGPPLPATRSASNAASNIVTTVGDVPTNTGSQVAVNGVPGPARSTISRQESANSPSATQTQMTLDAPAAGSSTQLARTGGAARAATSTVATLDPSGTPSRSPSRAVNSASVATSSSNVESPSASISAQGAGDVSAQAARMALSRGLGGVAGVGHSPNLDANAPGGSGPALTASSAAKRAQATQQNADGDALSPSAPARIARSRSGSDAPSTNLQVSTSELATQAGSDQAGDVTASSSAALVRADSNARKGSTTGAKGTGEVDLGAMQVVAEPGSGRAAGGGQAQLNNETQSPLLARSNSTGGAPVMSIAGAKVDEVLAAPEGTGGGTPAAVSPSATAVAATRTMAGGNAAASGGPSAADQKGPLTEINGAQLLASEQRSRADNVTGSASSALAGGAGIEDEEEKARRMARLAGGGGPQVALSGATVADVPTSPMGDGGDGGAPRLEASSQSSTGAAARQKLTGGAPVGGTPLAAGEVGEIGGAAGGQLVGNLAIVRAEAADGAPGAPMLGGGTSSPARNAAGPSLSTNTQAETIELAGMAQSGGEANGSPIEAQGGKLNGPQAAGTRGPLLAGPVRAAVGEQMVEGTTPGVVGSGIERRQSSATDGNGPAVGGETTGSPNVRDTAASVPGAGGLLADVPEIGPNSAVAQAELDHAVGSMGTRGAKGSPSGDDALAVNIEAPEGPGGLGNEFSPEAGLKTRQARSESDAVQVATSRFVRSEVGGLPSFSNGAAVTTDAFKGRSARKKGEMPGSGKGRPDPKTEESIEQGLQFLARFQAPNGNWSLQGFDETAVGGSADDQKYLLVSETGATALSLLAFQGAGYTHKEHQYKETVRRALEYLVKNQKENGDLFVALDNESNKSVWLYSHAMATLALCEAYGMTQDPDLREPAQKAVDFIVAAQHKTYGGWRYSPGVSSDTSVSGWMMMALKSAELSNLNVPKDTFQKIDKWLSAAQSPSGEPYLFSYNPYAADTPTQRHGRMPTKTMTSVGLLMRLYTGWKRDNPNMQQGAEYLRKNLPAYGTSREPLRDTYYWYYATQVMFHMQGKNWDDWKNALHPLLRDSQVKQGIYAGSWSPRLPVPDRWAPHAGRLYVTTMNLLSLEVEYRYLPLYEDTKK